MNVEEMRREIRETRSDSRGRKYSAELKAKIIAHAESRLRAGWKIGRVAEELGLSYHTLGPWMRALGEREKEESGGETSLVPVRVRVEPEPVPSQLVLVNRRGFRLEGIDIEQAVMLMERLS